MSYESLNRRELMELAGKAAALPGAELFFSAWARAAIVHNHQIDAKAPPQPDWLSGYEPKFFARDDFAALQVFMEILIPTDEDPGAREAYCAHFTDFVLQASSEVPKTQANWRSAMEAVKATGFYSVDLDKKMELVSDMSRPEFDSSAHHPAYFAYRLIKQQAAFAFYTSRVGMISTLDYRGNSYNLVFPGCNHPGHHTV